MNTLREAAQQALEALGKFSIGFHVDAVELNDLIATLEAALEQPEQEPVAWMTPGQDLHLNNGEGFRFSDWTPLYTHPPRREWRGLTDTERAAVQYESFKRGLSPLEFMELHEQKLKERNV